jgi:Fe-S-cluster containining protein
MPDPATVDDAGGPIEAADGELLRVLEADLSRAAALAGPWLACRPGCDACCIGPFPVTRLDALRLRRGLATVERERPEIATRILARSRAAVRALEESFPGDVATGRLSDDEPAVEAFLDRHAHLACPALDPDTGTCDLYVWRPVSCRTFGPPVRFGTVSAPPCELCFRGAPADVLDRCRIEPDAGGLEARLLDRIGAVGRDDFDTLIAFALAPARRGDP